MMQNFPIKDNATCVMNYNALKIHVENLSRVCSMIIFMLTNTKAL